ncbi:MAG: sulfatase family protein, partial [Pirellulaceae bacterium]
FDEVGTETPRIRRLAEEGLIFRNAFSNSPVCSVARSTLMTSCYPVRLGLHHHRTEPKIDLPPDFRPFPMHLRDAGYYTTNNVKTDYNFTGGDALWDESSRQATWRNRGDSQPFFHMQSFPVSHEGRLHFPGTDMDEIPIEGLDGIFVQPRHPDTELFRYTRARYHQQVQKMDEQVGAVIDQLRDDGLLENTFIFYFGDHGGPLPGSKAYLYETGLHVPLVVRVPENYREQIGYEMGDRVEDFVSFVDFGPTLLNLAGIAVPDFVDGRPFLGSGAQTKEIPDVTFGFADRFDERIGMVRSVRKGDFKYVRNYLPWYPDALQTNYRYRMAAYRQWREMFTAGQLNEVQSAFFLPQASEALYDIASDPYETRNLAGDEAFAQQQKELVELLREQQLRGPDLGFFSESTLQSVTDTTLGEFAIDNRSRIRSIVHLFDAIYIAPHQLPDNELLDELKSHQDPLVDSWVLSACVAKSAELRSLNDYVVNLLQTNSSPLVQLRAIEYLALASEQHPSTDILRLLAEARSEYQVVEVLNAIVMLRDGPGQYDIPVTIDSIPEQFREAKYVQRRLEYLTGR